MHKSFFVCLFGERTLSKHSEDFSLFRIRTLPSGQDQLESSHPGSPAKSVIHFDHFATCGYLPLLNRASPTKMPKVDLDPRCTCHKINALEEFETVNRIKHDRNHDKTYIECGAQAFFHSHSSFASKEEPITERQIFGLASRNMFTFFKASCQLFKVNISKASAGRCRSPSLHKPASSYIQSCESQVDYAEYACYAYYAWHERHISKHHLLKLCDQGLQITSGHSRVHPCSSQSGQTQTSHQKHGTTTW